MRGLNQLCFSAFISAVFASSACADITINSPLDCATWAKSRSENRADALEAYMVGLMNGLAVGSGTEFWNAGADLLKREQVYFWFDRFCANKPLSYVFEGAIDLMNERTNGAYSRRVNLQPN